MRSTGRQRGIALLQVMMVVALATILGYAVLSDTSLQAQASYSGHQAAEADALAESGVNLAMYYLLNPWNAPTLQDGYWPGGSDISLGAAVPGKMDVKVTRDPAASQEYVIKSTGRATNSDGELERTVIARVKIKPGLKIDSAVMSARDLLVASLGRITGNVKADGRLTSAAIISGTAYARIFSILGGSITSKLTLAPTDTVDVPTAGSIETFASYAYDNGRVYSRSILPVNAVGSGILESLGPTGNNPAGIYIYNGNFTLNNNVRIDGTLIVNGSLTVNGSNVQITGQSGYPALIVMQDIKTRSSKSMTVNGATFIGKSIRGDFGTSLFTTLTFNGAVMFGDAANIESTAGTQVRVTYNAANLTLPDLDRNLARSATVLSWRY